MARCPACGTVVAHDSTTCEHCGATFLAPAPDVPDDESTIVYEHPFSSTHRNLACVLGCFVAAALLAALAWWLANGQLGPGTTNGQWLGVAILLCFTLNSVRAFFRVRNGRPAYFGPNVSFHTQVPINERTATLIAFAVFSVALLVAGHFSLLK